MASASSNVGDNILWTALFCSAVVSYWYIPQLLHHVKQLAAVTTPKSEEVKPRLVEDAEAAIEPVTIETLAFGPSYPLSVAAVRLTARKTIKDDPTVRKLLADLASRQYDRRDRAIKALQLLLTDPILRESSTRRRFLGKETYEALVDALINILPEHERWMQKKIPLSSPVKPPHRSAQEAAVMSLIVNLMEEPSMFDYNTGHYLVNAQPALDAGIVTKWLSKYPFPCAMSVGNRYHFQRHDVVRLLKHDTWASDDLLMSRLVGILGRTPQGWQQLIDVGLKSKSEEEEYVSVPRGVVSDSPGFSMADAGQVFTATDDDEEDEGEFMSITYEPLGGSSVSQQSESYTELFSNLNHRQRQRRHRETVVVSNSQGNLNILQPPATRELEQEVMDRQDELLRPAHNSNGSAEESAADQIARERIDGLDSTAWTPVLPLLSLASAFEAERSEIDGHSEP